MENYRSIAKKPRLGNDESDSADEVQQNRNYSSRYYRRDRQEHHIDDIKSPCCQRRDSINRTPDQQKCEWNLSKSSKRHQCCGSKNLEYNSSVHTEGTSNRQRKRKRSPSCDCSFISSSDESVSTSKYNFQKLVAEAKVSFVDSHCHLDLLFQRSHFNGSFRDFMKLKQDSFPKNYLGCVAVFCYPKTWRKLLNNGKRDSSTIISHLNYFILCKE